MLFQSGKEKAKGGLILSSTFYGSVTESTNLSSSQRGKVKGPKATSQVTASETKFGHRLKVTLVLEECPRDRPSSSGGSPSGTCLDTVLNSLL